MAESTGTEAWLAYYRQTGALTDSMSQSGKDTVLDYARGFANQGKVPPSATTLANTTGLSGEGQGALQLLKVLFTRYGIDFEGNTKFAEEVYGYLLEGRSREEISLLLRDSETYKNRFKANDDLQKKFGYTMSPEEYVSYEQEVKNRMINFNLSADYYTQDRLQKIISSGVSASEVVERLNDAEDFVLTSPQSVKDEYLRLYGVNATNLIGMVLDPNATQDVLNKQKRQQSFSASAVAGAGKESGFTVTGQEALAMAQQGQTYGSSTNKFNTAAENFAAGSTLGQIYGDKYSKQEALASEFNLAGSVEATKKSKKLASQERGTFGGSSGLRTGSLAQEKGSL